MIWELGLLYGLQMLGFNGDVLTQILQALLQRVLETGLLLVVHLRDSL